VVGFSFDQSPDLAVKYFEGKGLKTSFRYDEIMHEAHRSAFTVAKVMNLDLLSDIQGSLTDAFKTGKSFESWKENIRPSMMKAGWWGEIAVSDSKTGEVKDIYVGSRRLRTIYDTNMRTAYAVQNYHTVMESSAPYLRYTAILDGRTRAAHARLHGMILPKDDVWWRTNYPPNGWKCRCKAHTVSEARIKAEGWNVAKNAPENVADPDFAYDIGSGAYKLDQTYFQKVQALNCIEPNAKSKTVPCLYIESVKTGYKEWAQNSLPSKDEWDSFVDRSLLDKATIHEDMRLGFLTLIENSELQQYFKNNPPLSDLILATTGSIRNLKAKGIESVSGQKKTAKKPKSTLTTDDIKELASMIHTPDEVYIDNGAPLLIWDFDGGKNKIVIGVDTGDKARIFNSLKSGQKYTDAEYASFIKNLTGEDR
jgi:SPP1 gp7 family putative phage head morphogenesis protein